MPHRLGVRPDEEALVVLLPPLAVVTPAQAALIDALCDSPKRLSVVLIAVKPNNAERLSLRFPKAFVHGKRLSLAKLRARALVQFTPELPPAPLVQQLIAKAVRRGIPVFGLGRQAGEDLSHGEVCDAPPLEALSPSASDGLPPSGDLNLVIDHLIMAMGFERDDGRLPGALGRMAQRLIRKGPGRMVLAPFARRVAGLDPLQQALNQPKVIMCLGNGPTSADARLQNMNHDALFRVNHQWKKAGVMTRADVIFAGVKASMRAAGSSLVAVVSKRKEQALLGTRLLAPWRGRLRYLVVEELVQLDTNALQGHPRPTTGAFMLATAIALKPDRLIVAGMDMFANSAGAYPGGDPVVNAYTSAHDRQTDTAFICRQLAGYEGEIVTLSPAFAELAQTVAEPRFTIAVPPQS